MLQLHELLSNFKLKDCPKRPVGVLATEGSLWSSNLVLSTSKGHATVHAQGLNQI